MNTELLDEIRVMSRDNQLNQEQAMRLLLRANYAILERLEMQEKRIAALENIQEDTPSIAWLWENDPKKAFLLIIAGFVMGLVLFSPIIISDIRHALLSQFMDILRSVVIP